MATCPEGRPWVKFKTHKLFGTEFRITECIYKNLRAAGDRWSGELFPQSARWHQVSFVNHLTGHLIVDGQAVSALFVLERTLNITQHNQNPKVQTAKNEKRCPWKRLVPATQPRALAVR